MLLGEWVIYIYIDIDMRLSFVLCSSSSTPGHHSIQKMRGASSSSANYLLTLKFMESSLRLSSIPLTVASIWVTVTNKQEDSVIYGSLNFKSFPGLK